MKNKIIISLLASSVCLTIGAAVSTKDSEQRFLALNSLAIGFSSAGLALITKEENIL
jgi:hypothetical protein